MALAQITCSHIYSPLYLLPMTLGILVLFPKTADGFPVSDILMKYFFSAYSSLISIHVNIQ